MIFKVFFCRIWLGRRQKSIYLSQLCWILFYPLRLFFSSLNFYNTKYIALIFHLTSCFFFLQILWRDYCDKKTNEQTISYQFFFFTYSKLMRIFFTLCCTISTIVLFLLHRFFSLNPHKINAYISYPFFWVYNVFFLNVYIP